MKNRLGSALVVVLAAACGHGTAAGPQPSSPTPSSAQTPAAATPDTGAGAATPSAPTAASASAGSSAAGSTPTAAEFEALYRARADSARLRFNVADVRFMQGMIHHHAQAIVMSRMAPSHGASPSVLTLAARIINAQQDEIRTMQQWLRDRHQAVPEVDATGAVVMAHDSAGMAMHHDMGAMPMAHGAGDSMAMMPGMLTPAQLEQLSRAQGQEFDRLFLTDMIQHHRGAITMVTDLFATNGAGQEPTAFKLASDVQVDQTTEVARMQRMLAQMALSGQGL